MLIFKGEWITNIPMDDRQQWVEAGFIVWNPKVTDIYTEEQLVSSKVAGVYVNPYKPDAKLPAHFLSSSHRHVVV